ncbi:MAG: RNA polymerase sigma-70 factor (ECF subfamily) [Bacteroidia bacterium]
MKNRLSNVSDEVLMELLSKGSKPAFNEIYARYSQNLLRYMHRMLYSNEAVAQDKLHDIFLKIIEKPHLFDTSKKFSSWIYKVASNECLKFHRSYKYSESLDTIKQQDTTDILSQIDDKAFQSSLLLHLGSLKIEHRQVFILRFQEHLSVAQISDIMDCPIGTTKSRIHYATKLLASKLESYNPLKTR